MTPTGQGDLKQAIDLLEADSLEQGHPLCMLGVTPDAKEELERLYGVNVLPVQADVSKDGDNEKVVRNVVDRAVETFGGIDVLINNAQASASGITLADHTTEQFDLAVYSGLYATFYYMKACYPYLKKSKGTVINFASGAGLFGNFGQCAYAAAKEGIRGLTRVAAILFYSEFKLHTEDYSSGEEAPLLRE